MSSKGVTSENKTVYTPPLSPPFKVMVFVVSYGTAAQHCMEGVGRASFNFFFLFKWAKGQKDPLGGSQSTSLLGSLSLRRDWWERNLGTSLGLSGVVALTLYHKFSPILTVDGYILELLTVDGYLVEMLPKR